MDAVPVQRRRLILETVRLTALAFAVFVIWATIFDKWSPSSFLRPIGYCWDGLFAMGVVKSAADFGFIPILSKVNSHLGAPYSARWNDFPLSEDFLFFFWGMVSRITGVIAAVNLGFLFSAVGAAVTLYGVGRWLRMRWEACFLAAVLFGLSPYLFYRAVYHFSLTNYWHLPLFIPVWFWVGGRRGLDLKGRRFAFALGVAVLAGTLNVYYLNYFLQLLGLGVLAQLLRRRWRKAAAGMLVVAAGVGGFVLTNVDTVWGRIVDGPNPSAVHRGAVEVETYALKPLELFVPGPRHRIPAFVAAGERHKGSTLAVGEFPSPYLGIIGGLAFLWLLGYSVCRVLLGRAGGWAKLGGYSVWLLGLAGVGGGMQILQTATGVVLFRSNNRASIFLLMFGLLFLARQLSFFSRKWPKPVLPAVALLLLAIGLFDQTPSPRVDPNVPWCESHPQREMAARADEKLVAELEHRVPAGTAVFQLPAMPFPENGWARGVPDYDPIRPYLFSKSLRFSYGNMKGRPEGEWQTAMASLPPDQLVEALEQRGFGALYVLRKGFSPGEQTALLDGLRAAGRSDVIESEFGDSLVVLLQPKTKPVDNH